MPNFARAQISTTSEDLSEYRSFLQKLSVGHVVTLRLSSGESSRKVARALNSAAQVTGMQLARIAAGESVVRFKVASPQKRTVNLSPDARKARAKKALATRAARRQA